MAKLFLSYSRNDEARARRFTQWLEREGHSVWRDEDDIGGGASFSSEIEKALEECDVVLVLWSAESVKSAWVRDEAAYGRDRGKLIPFSLDGTEPPLGFRQFQSVNLSRWKGHREPVDAERIRNAITRITGSSEAPAPEPSRLAQESGPSRRMLAGGAIAIVAAGALAFLLWDRAPSERKIAIAVLPSADSSDRAMATEYADVAAADMAASIPRRFDRATVIAPAEASGRPSAYLMQISTNPHGSGASASLTLSDQGGHTILWSKNWSVADASAADLKQDISASASKAALCLTDAEGGRRPLLQPALGVYLSGCANFGDDERQNADFQTIFERVTSLAPDFPSGWAYLALNRSMVAEERHDGSPAAYSAALQSARAAIDRARKLNPRTGITYHAEYHLESNDHFKALQALEKGAEIDPDDGLIQMHLSDELFSVGRLSDSVQAAQRAVELDPGSPYARSQYILALAYAGQFSRAKADIADARKKWPTDPQIDFAEYGFQYRYGDPEQALKLLPRLQGFSDADTAPTRMVIEARIDPTPAKMNEAIEALKGRWWGNVHSRNIVLLALGNFGRTEQAYQVMDDPSFAHAIDADVLFRPDFAAVRADPRFIQVASRLGLVRYWRQTGYWPDFCSSEQIRYNCRTEAAKYRD